jgi:hypothetical protein
MVGRSGLATRLGDDRLFHTIDEAVQALSGKPQRLPRRQRSDSEVR